MSVQPLRYEERCDCLLDQPVALTVQKPGWEQEMSDYLSNKQVLKLPPALASPTTFLSDFSHISFSTGSFSTQFEFCKRHSNS